MCMYNILVKIMMLGLIHVSDKHTVVKTILGIFYTNTLVNIIFMISIKIRYCDVNNKNTMCLKR